MSELELEKTYLAKYLPEDLESFPFAIIQDIYFPTNSVQSRLRLRQKGNKYEITKKSKVSDGDASKQNEETIHLNEKEFDLFKPLANGYVNKKRYFYTYQSRTAEIDVFTDNLEGLVLVEFEFHSEDEYTRFEMPGFCLADVTQDKYIAGPNLSGITYDDLVRPLQSYGYSKIVRK